MSWFGFAEEEEEDPNRKLLVLELYGGREITDPKTRHRAEGPAHLDVFCTLILGEMKFQTEIIKSSMHPVWQARFEIPIDNCLDSAVLVITCYHSGMITNTFIGEVRIPIVEHKDIAFDYAVQHWFPLFNPKLKKLDGSPGEIGLRVGAIGGDVMLTTPTGEYGEILDDRTAEEIYAEANTVALEGNRSAQRSVKLAEQARDIQANTMIRLKEQGQQIDRMQGDMDSLHNNMKQSERKLRGIESVWGSVANKVTSSRNSRYKKKAHMDRKLMKKRKNEEDKNRKLKQAQWEDRKDADHSSSKRKRDTMIAKTPGSRDVERGTQEEQFYQIIDDTDKQLDTLSSVLDDIKNISLDMGIELNEHNERLGALSVDVNKAVPRMDSAIKRSRVLLKG